MIRNHNTEKQLKLKVIRTLHHQYISIPSFNFHKRLLRKRIIFFPRTLEITIWPSSVSESCNTTERNAMYRVWSDRRSLRVVVNRIDTGSLVQLQLRLTRFLSPGQSECTAIVISWFKTFTVIQICGR